MNLPQIIFIIAVFFLSLNAVSSAETEGIRYAALGDSYTIGTGADPQESWPAVLVRNLQSQGFVVELVGNLGRNGWTTADVIKTELPELKHLNADFVTLLIGVNDWVQGVPADIFHERLTLILDELFKELPGPDELVVLTIPDFSKTPRGLLFSNERDIPQGLTVFNAVIKEECTKRGLLNIDLFSLSQVMAQDPSMTSSDGFHPSAKGYAEWEKTIEPLIRERLITIRAKKKGEGV